MILFMFRRRYFPNHQVFLQGLHVRERMESDPAALLLNSMIGEQFDGMVTDASSVGR